MRGWSPDTTRSVFALLLDRDRDTLQRVGRFGRQDDDEWIRAEGAHRLDDPVDKTPTEQRVQVLWRRGFHPRAEACRHDDCCEVTSCHQNWGARIRTWDRGTKTRCLTTWLRPITAICKFRSQTPTAAGWRHLATPHRGSLGVPGVREEIHKGDDREGYDRDDRHELEDEGEDDDEDCERLRRRGDPRQLTPDIPPYVAAHDDVEGKQDRADDEDSPLRQVGCECDEKPFDHGDPKSKTQPPFPEPTADARAAGFDHRLAVRHAINGTTQVP
jgi:hypothetical protein